MAELLSAGIFHVSMRRMLLCGCEEMSWACLSALWSKVQFKSNISTLIFCLENRCRTRGNEISTISVLVSFSPFYTVNIYFIWSHRPCWGSELTICHSVTTLSVSCLGFGLKSVDGYQFAPPDFVVLKCVGKSFSSPLAQSKWALKLEGVSLHRIGSYFFSF